VRPETYSRVRRETAQEILRYFLSHPAAKDTLEGIAKWWLDRQRIERGVDEVAESLRLLVARGFVVENLGRATQAFYQMNPAKRKEIEEFLNGPSKNDDGAPSRNAT
jgi:hypothetical protein